MTFWATETLLQTCQDTWAWSMDGGEQPVMPCPLATACPAALWPWARAALGVAMGLTCWSIWGIGVLGVKELWEEVGSLWNKWAESSQGSHWIKCPKPSCMEGGMAGGPAPARSEELGSAVRAACASHPGGFHSQLCIISGSVNLFACFQICSSLSSSKVKLKIYAMCLCLSW